MSNFAIALTITYIIFGLVYYSGSIIGMIKLFKSNELDLNNLESLKKSYQGAMGVCWKIAGYLFMPILLVIYVVFITYLLISTMLRRGE